MSRPLAISGVVFVTAAAATGFWALRAAAPASTMREYYIAAEVAEWDYAPSGMNQVTGQPFGELENTWVGRSPDRVGRVYRKALYVAYTDSTFTTRKPRAPEWEHLGYLGPLVRAVVGDTIRVVFRNNATFPTGVHPHGVIYDKASEGALYEDGTAGPDKADDAVPPGGTHTYVWPVPERAGPTAHETSSIVWMYHGHTVESRDVHAGLMGPLIITRRGAARADGTPTDVDRELVIAFAEIDENASWYIEHNVETYGSPAAKRLITFDFADPFFISNLMPTINGFLYGHTPGLTMQVGERVRWYVFATTGFELHAPHWHGQTAVMNHMRTDAFGLLTMEMAVADMVPDNPGTWLFHCHVGPHNDGGMQALFTVRQQVAAR